MTSSPPARRWRPSWPTSPCSSSDVEEVEAALTAGREQESRLEATLRDDLPRLAAAQETWFALSGLKERLRGTASLADERIRNAAGASETDTVDSGRDPDDLEAQAERVRRQESEIAEQVEAHRTALEAAVVARRTAEEAASEEERRIVGLQRAAADRREGLARLTGQVNALTSRSEAADAEIRRLTDARQDAATRADRAQRDFTALETKVAGLDAGEEGLDSEHEEAVAALDEVEEQLATAREDAQQSSRDRAGLVARRDALELGLNRKDGAGALLAAGDTVGGLLGSVAALLDVDHGWETAVAAALGTAADAVVVSDSHAAVQAIGHLKADDLGRAGLLLGGAPLDDRAWPSLPDGATCAVDVVSAPDDVRPALVRLLRLVAVVDDLAAARRLVAELPDVVAVTREGDLLGAHFAAGGSTSQPSLIEIQAAFDEATTRLADATATTERLGFEISRLEAARHDGLKRVDVALAKLHESDATLAAVAEELGQYGSQARAAKGEAERLERAIVTASEAREADLAGLADLEARLAAAEDVTDEEPDTAERERRRGRGARSPAGRDGRPAGPADRGGARPRAQRPRRLAAAGSPGRARVTRPGCGASRAADPRGPGSAGRLDCRAASCSTSSSGRSCWPPTSGQRWRSHARAASSSSWPQRTSLRDLGREHDELVNSVHRDEMARTQQKMRIEQLEERALDELGMDADGLVADYGPTTLIPFSGEVPEGEEAPEPAAFVREEQVKRLRSAERSLSMLGRVNPLALEEFSAMEERHKFLTEQLEDLKRTRKDLLDIVREVDARVEQVFTEAYADVSKAFDDTFSRLFPGGEGRLVLTDPARHARHGRRGRGPTARQEGQAALPALRWREVPGGGGVPGGPLQGPAVALLHPRRGRGSTRRHQPRPAARDLRGAAGELPAPRHHPPEAHDGGR